MHLEIVKHLRTTSQLNIAEISTMSRDMPFMTKYLINKIKHKNKYKETLEGIIYFK